MEYVPESLKKNAEFITHMPSFERSSDEQYLTDEEYKEFYKKGVAQLERYRDEATLVVTSRLHAAIPCMAMGIPVIIENVNLDGRFSWVEKYIHPYKEEEFSKINWNPDPIDYEDEKANIINLFKSRIKKAYDENFEIYNISSFYEDRQRIEYNSKLKKIIQSVECCEGKEIKYALWGIGPTTLTLKNVIDDCFTNWRLVNVIDQNLTGEFEGIKIDKVDKVDSGDKDIIYIVVPKAAHKFASEKLKKLGIKYILVE